MKRGRERERGREGGGREGGERDRETKRGGGGLLIINTQQTATKVKPGRKPKSSHDKSKFDLRFMTYVTLYLV